MRKTICLLMSALALATATPAGAYTLKRVSVHDPSVVWEPNSKYYYIFGSHRAAARTKDMMSWSGVSAPWGTVNASGNVISGASNDNAFVNNMTKTVTVGGVERELSFNALAWSAAYGNYNVGGNMWAPDVIYNPVMKKWCMYLSINGPTWNSSIILLTSNNITGPYVYQAPVVISGFNVDANVAAVSYKKTDLELVLGTQSSLPSRYNAYWGRRWPHAIDPCVFYDETGRLWMTYGSWSGGIWILELDEQTGLRDYDVKYTVTGSGDAVTSDPYFGKRIAGGFYSSGEGSYVEYVGGWYYLFISNGGLAAGGVSGDYNNGGYQMRVFRSKNPNGPYVDASGKSAVLTAYELNFGAGSNSSTRGVNIFGAYGQWGYQLDSDGERSQGHNSVIAAGDGRTYLVYHTRFQNGGEGHQVRVHQLFQNEAGWLVAAPFEYTGESLTSDQIATTQRVATPQIAGTYKLLIHEYKLDHTKKALSTPVTVQLNADGTITGAKTGTWAISKEGTSYVNIKLGTTTYRGVMIEQTLEPTNQMVPAFTALASTGVTVWGYQTANDPTTAIESTPTDSQQGPLFDLQGRRLAAPANGSIYIQNGRKILKK